MQAGAALHPEGAALMLPKEVKSMSKQRKMTEKKPMNRKKFIDEARSVYESMDFLDNLPYLIWGISEMLAHTTDLKPDLQAVGVAKSHPAGPAKKGV